jgi:hypothetical protein
MREMDLYNPGKVKIQFPHQWNEDSDICSDHIMLYETQIIVYMFKCFQKYKTFCKVIICMLYFQKGIFFNC